jgi:hypothetical protein
MGRRLGDITSQPVLGGLHHRYVNPGTTSTTAGCHISSLDGTTTDQAYLTPLPLRTAA